MKIFAWKNLIIGVSIICLLCSCQQRKVELCKQDVVMENILSRTSIRQYTDEVVSEEQIENLLHAAMAAPSACNLQPWRFVIITNKELKKQLADSIHPAGPAERAPLLIVICGDMTATLPDDGKNYWVEDCSAAAENLLLAANGMDLGAVWLGVYPVEKRINLLKDVLKLPSSIVPLGMFAIGHPAETPMPKDKWKPDNILMRYN